MRIPTVFKRQAIFISTCLVTRTLMTKHSKNNTASSIFSYSEYKKLDYGTKKVSYGFLFVVINFF